MYKLTTHEHRLVAMHIDTCDTVEEAQALVKDVVVALKQAPGLVVACVDFRSAKLFPQEVSDIFVSLLKSDNPKIERSAFIIGGGGAIFTLQIKRMLLEAQNPKRKIFQEAKDAEVYLGEILTPSQKQWLHEWYTKTP